MKMDRRTRKWHNLSNEVMSFLFQWEEVLEKMGVSEEDAEKWVDKCWHGYADLLLSTPERLTESK